MSPASCSLSALGFDVLASSVFDGLKTVLSTGSYAYLVFSADLPSGLWLSSADLWLLSAFWPVTSLLLAFGFLFGLRRVFSLSDLA